jgi:Tfp pilus assembly protein PilV
MPPYGRAIGSHPNGLEVHTFAADERDVFTRARAVVGRDEAGFGLIELIISMAMLNIGILAIVASFNSGALALKRAATVSTASVVADKQMELYRALKYTEIALDATATATANADTVYQCDPANKISAAGSCGGANQPTSVTTTCATLTPQCNPRQTVSGPDQRSYRVDTYISWQTPSNGRAVKLVTIVVRRTGEPAGLTRVASTFDESSGI